eukprot:Skav212419  [mRNA]  locus=scaffold202:77214:78980:+ [translate_table: standard]
MSQMYVLKRDGSQQEIALQGLDPNYIDPVPVTQKVIEGFYNGISTAEVDTLAAETCTWAHPWRLEQPSMSWMGAAMDRHAIDYG